MSATQSVLVQLPNSFQVEGIPYHKEPVQVSLVGKSSEWLIDMLDFAVRQRCADANAGKNNTPEGKKAVQTRLEKLQAGEIIGTGTRGPRQSFEEKAEVLVLAAWLLTDNGKDPATVPKKDLEIAMERAKKPDIWETITRRYVIAFMQQQEGLTPEQLKEVDKAKLQERVTNGIAKIKAKFKPDIDKKAAELKAASTSEKKVLDVSDLAL